MTGISAADTYLIFRMELEKYKVTFSHVAGVVEEAGGDIVGIDLITSTRTHTVRDVTLTAANPDFEETVTGMLHELPGVRVLHISDRTFLVHLGGKIEMRSKIPVKNRDDLSRVYTPGVAKVCKSIHASPEKAFALTIKRNTVAVVTDGTAVLGLGDIGPRAAMPVMEGKAMLFKEFADVDAFPICLDTKDPDEIIRIIKALEPAFGGINLEDISAPRCFEIEQRLRKELDIPVFHDDQHGTAVVMLAGLLNALKLTGRQPKDVKVVINGIGAAGIACTKMLLAAGITQIIGVDRNGAISRSQHYEQPQWAAYANMTNAECVTGKLSEVIAGADVFIGVSAPNILSVEDIKKMAPDPIVFAMANPDPEIDPDLAQPHVKVLATGRSDRPNQINNVLCFPGIFRGALDCRATQINDAMKLAAAKAIASVVSDEELSETYIIPSVFNAKVVKQVRDAVVQAAYETGVARKKIVNR